jgi:hypothetical protein
MTTQILRTIDRLAFETPLALALGASAGFVALTAPAQLMAQVPVAGDMGMAGRAIVAVLLAAICGGAGYGAMRRPAKPMAASAGPVEEIAEEEQPSGMPAGRLARFRRADAHPDAPPREPIIASRDLGEPFMDVAGFAPPPAEVEVDEAWWPGTAIPDGEYVELAADTVPDAVETPEPAFAGATPIEAVVEAVTPEPVAEAEIETQSQPQPQPAPRGATSISAMMERLAAGLERRASAPPRDPTPALRDALAELNRLAERRH